MGRECIPVPPRRCMCLGYAVMFLVVVLRGVSLVDDDLLFLVVRRATAPAGERLEAVSKRAKCCLAGVSQ